jgi:hypothetical protein
MEDRDEQILRHIGRYHISIRAVIEKLFFRGESSDSVLNRLAREGRIEANQGAIPGGLSYYQLSLIEARRLGIPDARAREDKSRVLRQHLSILWFCCMTPHYRKRLEWNELKDHFGRGKGRGKPHVAHLNGDRYQQSDATVYRVFMPAPGTKDERFLMTLRADCFEALQHPKLCRWIPRGTYRFAILVDTERRKTALQHLIQNRELPPVGIYIEVVPPLERLHQATRQASS